MFSIGGYQLNIPTLLLLLLQCAALLHILFSKHGNPSQAGFWLLLVSLLPGAGLIAYALFGITRFEYVRAKVAKLQREMLDVEAPYLKDAARLYRELNKFQLNGAGGSSARMQTLDRLFPENPALSGNHLEILQDGVAVYPRMLEDMRKAKKCIRLQSFILNNDAVGKEFMKVLHERAAAGVDVKVLVDSVGSFRNIISWTGPDKYNGKFSFRAFSPINIFAPWKFQLRNHRKLLVVDGTIAYVGGVNIHAENERLKQIPPSRYIHDLHCRITGPAVTQLNLSFMTDYIYTSSRNRRQIKFDSGDCVTPEAAGDAVVRVLPSGPGNLREGTRKLFFAAAALAERELWIITPYFVPGRDYVDALCMAAARGVDVKLVLPAANNHFFVDCAARNFYEQLLSSGVKIYEKLGYFSHSKALLVDSQWGFMGSSNCDSRSFYLNFELDFCFEKSDFVLDMIRQFQQEIVGSRKLTMFRLSKTPRWRRLLNSIAALFTPIL